MSCGIGAGFFTGTGAFLYAPNYSRYGFAGAGILGPGTIAVFLMWRLACEIRHKIRKGTWFKKKGTRVFGSGDKSWKNLVPLLIIACGNITFVVVISFTWKFAKIGGLNQGAVTTVVASASVFNAITFYCCFGEKINFI